MVVRSFDLGGKEGTRGFFVFFFVLVHLPPHATSSSPAVPSTNMAHALAGWLADTIILEQYTTRKCSRIARRLSWRGGVTRKK
jgi:hypothetical protein